MQTFISQTACLADQIRRAFEGDAWHGDSIKELLTGVTAATAAARPIKNAHSVWELVLHIAAWDDAVYRRIGGAAVELTKQQDFPPVKDTSPAAWRQTLTHLEQIHQQLIKAVAAFPDSRLKDQVPGKPEDYYDFYYMFSGIVQHELYHAGQIALLKKALHPRTET
jgi:uncharacterized damage-inducible protein DinB